MYRARYAPPFLQPNPSSHVCAYTYISPTVSSHLEEYNLSEAHSLCVQEREKEGEKKFQSLF